MCLYALGFRKENLSEIMPLWLSTSFHLMLDFVVKSHILLVVFGLMRFAHSVTEIKNIMDTIQCLFLFLFLFLGVCGVCSFLTLSPVYCWHFPVLCVCVLCVLCMTMGCVCVLCDYQYMHMRSNVECWVIKLYVRQVLVTSYK